MTMLISVRSRWRRSRYSWVTVILLTCCLAAGAQTESGLSVSDAVRIALREHPSLAAARGRQAESAGRVRQVKGQKALQLDLSSSYFRYDTLPPNKANILGGGNSDLYSEIVLSQVLTTGGRIEGQIDAARMQQAIEQEGFRRTAQQVVFQVRRAFYALENAGRVVGYYTEAENQMAQHLEIARGLVTAGKAAHVDVLRAEVQLANVRQALLKARNAKQTARMALNNAMGRGADTPLTIQPTPGAGFSLPPERALPQILDGHPEARISRLTLRRSEAEVRSAKAAGAPSLAARASYNYEGSHDPFQVPNWNVGVVLTFPLVDGGVRRGGVEQAEARVQQAQASSALTRQRIELDVGSAWLAVVEARERVHTTQAAVDQAAEALRILEEKFRVGLGSSIDVLDAQTALTGAQANQAQAVTDFETAVAQWQFAAGLDPAEGSRR
jgi:outer membrane protein